MKTADPKAAAARAFVRSLNILLKFARLYGYDHARTAEQLKVAWEELREAIPEGAESGLLLGATGSQLLLDGVPLEGAPAEKQFAQLLSMAGLASIQFYPCISEEELASFAHAMLRGGTPILRPGTISLFTRRESSPPGTSRALGWDTPSAPSQSGKYFGPRSYGHLGYTGTSLWVDPDRNLSITLLTNRTWPDCKNQAIKQVRPRFHDAVIEAVSRT